jgi:hypothetical protein
MRAASAATAAAVSFFNSIQTQILLPNLLATTDADVFHPQFLSGMSRDCPDGRDWKK